jgi:hypothetical protein
METIETGILKLQASLANFAFAREKLISLQATSVGPEIERVEHALKRNQEAADSLQRKLAGELDRLRRERAKP